MNDLTDLEKEQWASTSDIIPTGEWVLAKLGIDPTAQKSIKPRQKRIQYRAIINWLTNYKPQPEATALEQIRGYLETLHHLCQVKTWKGIKVILNLPIRINPPTVSLSILLSEYLLFKELPKNLLEVSENLISSFKDTENEFYYYILMLKARALAGTNERAEEASDLFKEIILKLSLPEDSEIHIEATARLAIHQVKLGLYQEGIGNLQKSLQKVNNLLLNSRNNSPVKFQDLRADLLDSLALYEMNSSRFKEAMNLHTEVIETRKKYGMSHKLIVPLVHQGVLMRKLGNYNEAIKSLREARIKSIEINNKIHLIWIDHHLAWVLIDQDKDIRVAEKLSKSAFEEYKKLEDPKGISDCYQQQGFIHLAKDEIDEAEKNFELALNLRKSIGNLHGTASSVQDLALVSWHKKRYLKSISLFFQTFYLHYKLGILNDVRFFRLLYKTYVWIFGKRNWNM
jgi:tetratricopeptide (TPR) repeat protein